MIPQEDSKIQNEILKNKKGFERLEIAFELNDFSRNLIKNKIRSLNPNLSEGEIEKIVIERFKAL